MTEAFSPGMEQGEKDERKETTSFDPDRCTDRCGYLV